MNNPQFTTDALRDFTPEQLRALASALSNDQQADAEEAAHQEGLSVILAANTVDALRDVTTEQRGEIIVLWSDILRVTQSIAEFNRNVLIEQAMEDSSFDLQKATEAGRAILNGLNQQLGALEQYKVKARERGDLLTKHLTPVATGNQNMTENCARNVDLLKRRIASAGDARQAAFEQMVEMGVPADVAKQSAKPTLADVAVLEQELEAAKVELEGYQAIAKSLSLQAQQAFA